MNFYAFIPRLLNMSLTASVAIVFVLLLRLMLKKAPKVISYALWAVVLFRLLCPISIESSFSLFGLMDAPTKGSTTLTTNIEYVPEDIVHTEHPAVALPIPGISNVINSTLPSGREQLVADPLEAPVTFATYVWLAGVLVMAAYSVISYRRLRQKLLTASPLRDNIYLADEITSPFVMGLIRPKIYLPSEMDEREQAYIIRHEQHHIRRGDHIIKALAFLALSIHWFNPLVWVAFIYSSKDMEMSCDEAVVKKMGDGILADYTASLLSLATGKQIIAGMPLAFGEGDTKSRIRNLANWRKPAFWVVLISVVACIASAVGLLTNPGPAREFPINGSNVSELDTEQIIEMIAKAERLGKNSQLYVYEENLMINQNFDWLFDGSLLRFYYFKSQKTYSGQLEMSRDENRFFIADTEEWTEPKRIYRLSDYLNALKYMPQEDIRQLYPNADTYVVSLLSHGDPSSYEHVITYTQNGIEDIDGWYIHLMVSPTYEAEPGGYYGSGEELLHLFYHSTGKTVSTAINTYIYEYDGIIGRFDIALGADGSFTYLESGYSSYLGHGTWKLSGDLITLTENVRVEDIPINRINHFKLDGDDLIYVAKDSFNFPHVKLEDGDRFHCTDEAFNLNNAGVTDLTSNEIVSSGQEVKLIPGNYDFDHDGVPESVEVLTYQGWFELQVKRADGTILWSDVAGAAHTGYNSLFACTLDGVDYLLRYHPTMYQGDSSYIYQLFSFDTQGNIIINREAEVYFDINWGSSMHREFNAAEIADFMDEVNDLLAHSKLLLSTDEALELIDPDHPQDIPWWLLDGTYCSGYVYDESKSLRDNLLALQRLVENTSTENIIIPTVADVRANGYPKNEMGQTYGPDIKENIGEPDLILVCNEYGQEGYVRKADFDDGATTLEDAANHKPKQHTVDMYLHDGITVIGEFKFGDSSEDTTNTNSFLPNTQKVQVVYYSAPDVHEWELTQEEIGQWRNWLNDLTLEQVSFESGEAPETPHTGGSGYIFHVNSGEVQVQYIDKGADGVYLFLNDVWYKVNNPTEPFNRY